jgi:hypothetical protein
MSRKTLKKNYPVTAFRLWKCDDKGKWYSYNHVFDSSDVTTYDYMSASKMMCHGWKPYAIAMIPGKHDALELEMVDYAPLEEMLKESDPVGVYAGNAIREFLHKLPVDGRKTSRSQLENKAKVLDRALTIAIKSYKNGSYVPKHLLERVLEGEQNV